MKRHFTWLYFEIDILAALTQLWAATITRNHLNMAEMDSELKKKSEMAYHMCVCPKNHLEAVFDAAFGLWRPST